MLTRTVLTFSLSVFLYMSPATAAHALEINSGRVVDSDGAGQYQKITQILDQYKRAFTVLDIGADQGYYSLKIAHEYDAVCVMIEANNAVSPHKGEQLLHICKANQQLSNLIFLNKQFTSDELQHLSECEHFDVILALNVLERFGDSWQSAVDAVLNMGDHAIIGLASGEQSSSVVEAYIIMKGGHILGVFQDYAANTCTTLYIVESNKKYLQRKTWLLPKMKKNDYLIESSFTEKKLTKKAYWPQDAYQITSWIPGINMLTFKMCNGVCPTKEIVKASLQQLKDSPHTDWMINNMVIQGNKLVWIDVDDVARAQGAPLKPTKFSEVGLQAHEILIGLDAPQKIEHYFWNRLIRVPIARKHRAKFIGHMLPNASLVFDIAPRDDAFVETCLGHGAKVICFELSGKVADTVFEKFKDEDVIIVDNDLIERNTGKVTLDNMIKLYGCPQLCAINLNEEKVYPLLKGLSQKIPYIIFKFDIRLLSVLDTCLQHLVDIGYTDFNFSARDIPVFALDANVHTGCKKGWATCADDLLSEIRHFAELDYDGKNVWGYVYAQYRQ